MCCTFSWEELTFHGLTRVMHECLQWKHCIEVVVDQLKPKTDEVGDIHFVLSREMVTSILIWPIIALCILRLLNSRHSWPRILSCLWSVFYSADRAKVCWDKGGMMKRLRQETFVGIIGDMLTIESLPHLHFALSIWCFRNVSVVLVT